MTRLALVLVLLLGAGCSQTTAGAKSALQAKRAQAALVEPQLQRPVDLTLPDGWQRISPTVAASARLGASLTITEGKARKSIEMELSQYCRMLTIDGWGCAEHGMLSSDRTEGVFTYGRAERRGMVAVRRFPDGHIVVLRGEWPIANNTVALKQFRDIVSSVTLP